MYHFVACKRETIRTMNTRCGYTSGTRDICACDVIISVTCLCDISEFATGPLDRCARKEGNPICSFQITGTSSVMSPNFFCHAITPCWPISA